MWHCLWLYRAEGNYVWILRTLECYVLIKRCEAPCDAKHDCVTISRDAAMVRTRDVKYYVWFFRVVQHYV